METREEPKFSGTGAPVQRTPGPWKVETFGRYQRLTEATHEDDNNDVPLMGDCEDEQVRANLEFIVKAANAHNELVAALQAEQEWREREEQGALDPEWDYETMVGAKRRAALAKVTQ